MNAAGSPALSAQAAETQAILSPAGSASQALLSRWILPQANSGAATLAASAGLPLIVAELLTERGVRSAAEAEHFLHPRLEHLLDPYTMHGMDAAAARVQAAIARREPILIYGDYDVDGTTAVVLLKTAIEMLGGEVRFHVPHRLREGYGMQAEVLAAAAGLGARLVISVDTGIRGFAAAEAAASLGLDLIITDHHLPQDAGLGLPRALAILNPNQPGCSYACKHLCGAGVAFKLAQALLEARDVDRARSKILPSFLKMLAIATVADAVPLLGAPLPALAHSDAITVPEPADEHSTGAEPAGLPIFDSVESEYFRAYGDPPAAGGLTSGGLPQRSRQASVAPGTAAGRQASQAPPARASVSAHITGSRLASFQQGSRRARAVARTEREAQPAEDD